MAKQKSIDYVMKWMYYAAWSWKDHELTTDQYLEGVRKIDEEMRKMHEIEIAAAYANGYNDRSEELDFHIPDSEMESLLEQSKQYYREHFELDRNKTIERVSTNETYGSVSVNTTTEIHGVDRNSVIPSEPQTIRENRNK